MVLSISISISPLKEPLKGNLGFPRKLPVGALNPEVAEDGQLGERRAEPLGESSGGAGRDFLDLNFLGNCHLLRNSFLFVF